MPDSRRTATLPMRETALSSALHHRKSRTRPCDPGSCGFAIWSEAYHRFKRFTAEEDLPMGYAGGSTEPRAPEKVPTPHAQQMAFILHRLLVRRPTWIQDT